MTRDDLEQLRAMRAEIRSLSISMLRPQRRYATDYYKDYRKGFPVVKPLEGVEDESVVVCRMERKLKAKQRRLAQMVSKIEEWLDSVDDSETRAILRLYYAQGYSQADIADKLGYSRSAIAMKLKAFWMRMEV